MAVCRLNLIDTGAWRRVVCIARLVVRQRCGCRIRKSCLKANGYESELDGVDECRGFPRPFRAQGFVSELPGMLSPANFHKPSGLHNCGGAKRTTALVTGGQVFSCT